MKTYLADLSISAKSTVLKPTNSTSLTQRCYQEQLNVTSGSECLEPVKGA